MSEHFCLTRYILVAICPHFVLSNCLTSKNRRPDPVFSPNLIMIKYWSCATKIFTQARPRVIESHLLVLPMMAPLCSGKTMVLICNAYPRRSTGIPRLVRFQLVRSPLPGIVRFPNSNLVT